MAKIEAKTVINGRIVLSLSEIEARAFDALVGYGHEDFLERFKEKFGKHYMQGFEPGFYELWETVRKIMPTELGRIDAARKAFDEYGKPTKKQNP